jgi:hypothetical protein
MFLKNVEILAVRSIVGGEVEHQLLVGAIGCRLNMPKKHGERA